MNDKDNPKTLMEHIIDLRSVIFHSFVFIIFCMILSGIFIDDITNFILSPIIKFIPKSTKVVYTSITEPFTTHMRITFYTSLFFSFPYIMFEIWKFIRPALTQKETYYIKYIMISSHILFILGSIFAFYIVVPNIISFLTSSSESGNNFMQFLPKMSENVSFILILILSFGLSFQIPIVMILLDRLHIVSIQIQKRVWREFVMCIVILSAIITPPDAFSMILLSVPLISLYFVSIFICSKFFTIKKQ